MHAKFVKETIQEDFQKSFVNNLRNDTNLGIKVYSPGQYESSDKKSKRKKAKKKISEWDSQNFRTPFATTSALRNNQRTENYPLSRIQYEDADKPQDEEIYNELDFIPCKVCGTLTNPKEFVAGGVCKRCAKQGFWIDNFGRIHNQNSRIRHIVPFESLDEKFVEKSDPVSDMGISGINFNDIYHDIKVDAAKKWIRLLTKTLVGRTIRCIADKWGDRHGDWKEYTFKVKRVLNTLQRSGLNHEIELTDTDDNNYTLLTDKKVYIVQ